MGGRYIIFMDNLYDTSNERCKKCKFSYIENQYTHSVLPPLRRCGKLDSPCKNGVCNHFEPRNDHKDFFEGPPWTITANSGN